MSQCDSPPPAYLILDTYLLCEKYERLYSTVLYLYSYGIQFHDFIFSINLLFLDLNHLKANNLLLL